MYILYGYTFLQESYLYHVTRTDHRHNFSVYFYQLYLEGATTTTTTASTGGGADIVVGLLAFLPQVVLLLAYAFRYCWATATPSDLTFCVFVQTVSFVIFNKVCTVQVSRRTACESILFFSFFFYSFLFLSCEGATQEHVPFLPRFPALPCS